MAPMVPKCLGKKPRNSCVLLIISALTALKQDADYAVQDKTFYAGSYRALNQGADKDRPIALKPSNCLEETRWILAKC
jgi:hypothetical protein